MSEDEAQLIRLLDWIASRSESSDYVPVIDFYGDSGDIGRAFADLTALENAGLVNFTKTLGSLAAVQARITSAGRAKVGEWKEQRENRSLRQWACRSALISWLYKVDAVGSPRKQQPWAGFLTDAGSLYYGFQFTLSDMDDASGWLNRNGLIGGVDTAQRYGPVKAYLTDAGESCADDFNGDVRAYRDAMSRTSPGNRVSFTVGGDLNAGQMQVVGGDSGPQTISVTHTTEGLALAVQGMADIIKALGYAEGCDDQLDDLAAGAVEQLNSDAPDAGGIQRFAKWVTDCAAQGGNAAVIAAFTLATSGLMQHAEQLAGLG
jgi:hypothetical protein